jgi:rhamnosyltransferase
LEVRSLNVPSISELHDGERSGDASNAAASTPQSVCAIVITYHPGEEFPRIIERFARQVGATVIVDNGSGQAELVMLREIAADPSIQLICNGANLGIAAALNIGIRRAAALGFEWVLLMDQDSYASSAMVEALNSVRSSFPDPAHLAVVGSGYDDEERGPPVPAEMQHDAAPWQDMESVITSGSLLSLAAYTALGPFREDFFIDHVDTEYCLRARLRGYRVIKTRSPLMSHAIGAPTTHRILWMEKRTTNHGPDRRYYFTRNDTVLLRERGRHPGGLWILKALMRSVRTCKRILLYEQMKAPKIKAVFHGWWDGVRGRLGPRE